ncbi:MAG: hypothetical protein ABSF97_06810 [Candidatus Sulfotelmatobacter sp.]|jgi:hypothetical protein
MSVSGARKAVSWVMLMLTPQCLMAADTASAIVHSTGGVWVNGSEVSDSTTLFAGDLLETKPGFVADLDAQGSSVLIQPESIVKFQGAYLVLEHGSVAVGTSTSMSVHVNCIKVDPITQDRTQYDVTDLSGKVEVAAIKKDVNVTKGGAVAKTSAKNTATLSTTVHEGQKDTRYETTVCGAAALPQSAGNALNTKWLEIGGGVAGGVVALCLILCKGKPENSISPSNP